MDTCRAGRCKITSPPGGCACVYIYETDSCNCECFGDEPSGSTGVLSLGNKIDVSVSGIPLGQVAAQFDRLLDRSVPAARVRKKVRIRLNSARLRRHEGAGADDPERARPKGRGKAKRAGR